MNTTIKLLDVVALLEDLPAHNLLRGHVGTVVELLPGGALEVEFADDQGRTYAQLPLRPEQVIPLRYSPGRVA